ncbi:uncharacterized protein J4E84_007860 [Alternaria hordeiaustralica]|uniref:uncharacterized protein n=1 Tax=Alternaria hordeiaustralica TaxID=1187925 RepID=UPI0020C2D9FD|nr:uncharacterized protein J4E84_007860 [Alternaria hordeiaustralica]KAI4680720.1 hypothetical protein J4E84_007860 [Alternaria hordeiaustralica]
MSSLTDADCEKIFAELMASAMSQAGYPSPNDGSSSHQPRGMEQLLPDIASIDRYHEWRLKQTNQEAEEAERIRQNQPRPTAADLIKAVQETDFYDGESREAVYDILNCIDKGALEWGMHCDYHFGLVPDGYVKLIYEDEDVDWDDQREWPEFGDILGINMWKRASDTETAGAQPKEIEPDQSGLTNESRGNDATGFVFMQLGRVFCLKDCDLESNKQRARRNEWQRSWSDSNFILVVAIEENGRAGAPWLVCNFNPENDIEGGRTKMPQSKRFWGTTLGDGVQYKALKIADDIEELKQGKAWDVTMKFGSESDIQIVPAVFDGEGKEKRLLRHKVRKEELTEWVEV